MTTEQNSDATILKEISQQLLDDARLDCCDVSVEVHGRHARLMGRVPSPEMKDLLEAIVTRTPGVIDLENQIRIEREP